jgi:D-galactarolactone cycloisomerase
MIKITAVRTYLLKHKLSRATGPANAYTRVRSALLVKLETNEGLCGWGETVALPGIRGIIDDHLSQILVGRDPRDHRRLMREMWGQSFGSGIAIGAVSIALDDLRGKALQLPVCDLYGGRLRDRVPVYASGMNYIEGEDPLNHYAQEAAQLKAQGFAAMKMRIGGQTVAKDLAAIEAVRAAVGPDVKLMADGNGAYSLGGAIEMGRELERLRFTWFEEPMPQNTPDYPSYETLTEKLDIPIAAGEGMGTRGAFRTAITARKMAIIQPDPALAGGVGECLFIAEMARLWGMQCMPHTWAGGIVIAASVHLLSMLPDFSWGRNTDVPLLELDQVENPFRDAILTRSISIKNGHAAVPNAPGLGIEVDEERVASYAKA